MASSTPSDLKAAQPDRRRWLALSVILTATFLDLVDVTIVNIAIPSIQRDIGATIGQIQWITAGYALAFAVGLITGGRLGDIFGRKRLFLVGVSFFTLSSALCGLAPSGELLLVARVLQGTSAALMVPQVLSIVHATFPAHERGKVFGLFGAILGLGGVSGPLLGALLTEWNLFGLDWRLIFLINLPVGIAALILGGMWITESRAPNALRLDLVGVALVTVGMLMLVFPLTLGREMGWPLWGHLTMASSVLVLGALVLYERHKSARDGSPLIELSLFTVASFRAGIGVQVAFGIVTGIFFLVWTLYLQAGLGWGVLRAGLTGIPFSVATMLAASVSVQWLVPKFGRKVPQVGALAMATGMVSYIAVVERYGMEITPWQMALPLAMVGTGMGLITAPLANAVLSEVPRAHSGSASGLFNTALQMGHALGLALTSVVFFRLIGEGLSLGPASPVYADAYQNALWWVVGILVVVFLLLFFLPSHPVRVVEEAEETGKASKSTPTDGVPG